MGEFSEPSRIDAGQDRTSDSEHVKLSTASAVFVTPLLSLLLIGKRLPIDVKGMVWSILQIVVAPIAAGLFHSRFFPWICNAIRPFLSPLSVLVTAWCIGAPPSH